MSNERERPLAPVLDDELLTVAEIADALKLNQQTVRNIIDRGELPALRVGERRVRVLRSDLDAFLTERRRITRRSPRRVAYDDAVGAATKALRGRDHTAAVTALRSVGACALELADELAST
jgi:excisionase family DNA binding protein